MLIIHSVYRVTSRCLRWTPRQRLHFPRFWNLHARYLNIEFGVVFSVNVLKIFKFSFDIHESTAKHVGNTLGRLEEKSAGKRFLFDSLLSLALSLTSLPLVRVVSREHTSKRQKGMWGSESVCQRTGVSPRGEARPSFSGSMSEE